MVQNILTGSSAGTSLEFWSILLDLGISYRFILFFLGRCVLLGRTNHFLFAVEGYIVTIFLRFVLDTARLNDLIDLAFYVIVLDDFHWLHDSIFHSTDTG
jgi:hypothetical protein